MSLFSSKKTIVVTGGLGFIGSTLVDKIKNELDFNVIVFDNLNSESANIEHRRDDVEYYLDDVSHIHEYSHYIPYVDYIFHLAANSRIQPSFKNPLTTIRNNSMTTTAVCEFARHKDAKVIYAGSSSFYAGIYKNPYAFSKWQGEQICEMYGNIYNLEYAIPRFFNVYGPRQPYLGKYATVIGIFERQYVNKEPLTIVGTGEKRRDFTHVDDICSGLIALMKPKVSGIYNLGTGINYSITDVADLFGTEKKYIPDRPGEAQETLADISKTLDDLDWTPEHSLRNYIKEFLNNKNNDI